MATLPNPNPVPNDATVFYDYLVGPTELISTGVNSNTVSTQINLADLQSTKTVDKAYSSVGQTLLYQIVLNNSGNVTANNIIFSDTIPSGTSFINSTFTIDGVTQPSFNPQPPGGNVGNIAPGNTSTLTFLVLITTLPTINPIPNSSTSAYSYTVNPTIPNGGSKNSNSNIVSTQINQAIIDNSNGGGLVKYVDKTYAKVGDTITYTIVLKNTGNVSATNVVFTDTIPNNTTFKVDSVFLNTINQPGVSPAPPTGVTVGTIAPSSAATLLFSITVDTIPTPNPIPNSGTVNYNFTVDPSVPDTGSSSGNTNRVTTQINYANFSDGSGGVTKYVDKAYGKVTDVLTYRIVLKNTGNVTANNIVFTDTIPLGTTFNTGSILVNNISQSGNPAPPTGINISSIGPLSVSTILFTVTITTIPTINPIVNQGKIAYTYTTDPSTPNGSSGQNLSNNVNTQVNQATIDNTNGGGLVKYVDKAYADVGDTLEYKITLKNTGNVTANNVVFTDTIPIGTSFIINTVSVNGINQPGTNPAPPTGFNVGSIAPGSTTTIIFNVTVTTIPTPNPIPNNSTVNYQYTVDPSLPNGQSGSGNSNTVNTKINSGGFNPANGGITKYVDKGYAKVSDILNYKIVLKNTGNATANNVVFTDTIPTDTSFIINSVSVNGTNQPGTTPIPPTGLTLSSIAPGGVTTIDFQVSITTIPSPNPIPNSGKIAYTYTVDPLIPDGKSGQNLSNTVNTQVNQATIDNTNGGGLVKTVDKAYAKVGDTLTYIITLTNTGNISANNIVVLDTIPNGTSFQVNSVYVNGVNQIGVSPAPPTGVTISTLGPSATASVLFLVTVTTIPSPNPIPNNSTVRYNYTVDPSIPNGQSGSGNSNQVNTQVNQANIDNSNGGGLVKYVDKAYAQVGETVTYTIVIKNTGNISADNVVFTDTIPNNTTFNVNSVFLNTVNQPGISPAPPTGVTVGTIGPSSAATILFSVTVDTIPVPNPIPNDGTVNYNFTVDPSVPNGGSGSGNTNRVTTQVNYANFNNGSGGITKYVDKAYGQVGSILTYRIVLKNTGNVTANNLVFTDTIPLGTTFNTGSILVNNSPQSGNPAPPTGINISSIGPLAVSTILFTVTVNTLPTINPIVNQGKIAYSFTTNPSIPNGSSGQSLSNNVNTQINQANIDNTNGGGLIKYVDRSYASVGNVINYTIVLKNTGNVSATNVVLKDTIPNGTTFNSGSVYINSTPSSGSPAPPGGLSVGTIAPNSTLTVIFAVTVVTIPTPNPIPNNSTVNYNFTIDPSVPDGGVGSGNSNQVTTQVNQAIIDNTTGGGLVKLVTPNYAKVGDTINYSVVLKNTGNVAANNVNLTDTIPNNTTFIPGSVTLNGSSIPGNPAPPSGVNIGSIAAGATSTVRFDVTIDTMPNPNPIPNTATALFNFTVDPSFPNAVSASGNTNFVNTQVNQAVINEATGGIVKTVDKDYAKIGDILNYTISIFNSGNTNANNVIFKDTIPSGTSYVTGSVFINGVNQPSLTPSPPGFNAGSIVPGGTTTIKFQVTVITLPNPNPIPNSSNITFNYTIDPSVPNGGSASGNSNIVTTQVNQAVIDNVSGGLTKYVDKSFAEVGDILTYSIVLKNTGTSTANNLIFKDTIPQGTTFNSGSVIINGSSDPGSPAPPTGLSLGTLGLGATSTIIFTVTVDTVPNPNPTLNSGTATFTYTVDPAIPDGSSGSGNTNIVSTTVVSPNLTATKTVDLTYADVGSTLNYTIVYKNTGNVSLNNVTLIDTIPNNTTFINNTLYLNGVNKPGANPVSGYNIGTLSTNAVATVIFSVSVFTIPATNPITNNAVTNYNYQVGTATKNSGLLTDASNSTFVYNASFNPFLGGFSKYVDKEKVTVGSTINYTLYLRNTGNVTAFNVVFTDTIPTGTNFINNSLAVNGATFPNNVQSGITLGTIGPGVINTINFAVSVVSIVPGYKIVNQGKVNYNYTVNPSQGLITGNNLSNEVISMEYFANVSLTKSSNKSSALVGSTIVYEVVAKNSGNTTANNLFINDTLPSAFSYVSGSVTVNGTSQPSYNIITGFTIPSLGPSAISSITFKAIAVSVPRGGVGRNVANSTYTYSVDPSLPDATGGSNSNSDTIIVSYYFNPEKKLPCSIVTTTVPVGFMSRLSARSNSSCTQVCGDCGTYKVDGLCTQDDYVCVNQQIAQYKMWQEQSFNSSFIPEAPWTEIESISATISIIRSDKIYTPDTGTCPNGEGKLLSGSKQIIEGVIRYTVTTIDTTGEICTANYYDLFSSFIVINRSYEDCELEIRGCIEDLSITKASQEQLELSATIFLYLVPETTDCGETCICEFDDQIQDCVSNSALCPKVTDFVSSCETAWNEFNAFFTEDTGINNIGQLSSINATISNIQYKAVSTPKVITDSNEGLYLSGSILLVSFIINIKINYVTNDGTNIVKRLNLRVPASTYIVIDTPDLCSAVYTVGVCIEDVYACNLDGNRVFTNTTLLVKAKVCNPTNCC